jgi:hypothetical protein
VSGSMRLPTSNETVGGVGVYITDSVNCRIGVDGESICGSLQRMLRVDVMARLGVAVWWWWCSSLHTP